MNKFLPYALPLFSLFAVIIILSFTDPTITGLAVAEPKLYANITLTTSNDEFLPETATIEVEFKGRTSEMELKEFIEKTNQEYNHASGVNNLLSYEGMGFIGDYHYSLPITEFDLDRTVGEGEHDIIIRIIYDEVIISESKETVKVE